MSKIQMQCEDHPKYKGIYSPKDDCLICWKIFATRLNLKLKELQQKYDVLNNK